jgi:autotransporter-associated beta strand protein
MFNIVSWLRKVRTPASRPLRRSVKLNLERFEDRIVPDSGGAVGQLVNGNLVYNGGSLLTNVRIEPIFIQDPTNSSYTAFESQFMSFFNTVAGNGYISTQLSQYSEPGFPIGDGSVGLNDHNALYAPDTTLTDNLANTVPAYSDVYLQSIIPLEVGIGNTEAPTANTLYLLITPPDAGVVNSVGDSINNFLGYHSSFTTGGNTFYYAVIPDQTSGFADGSGNLNLSSIFTNPFTTNPQGLAPFQGETVAASQQLANAITDPVIGTGWNDATNGDVGDMAAKESYTLDGYQVQYLFSQQQNSYVNYIQNAQNTVGNPNDLFINQITPPTLDSVSTSVDFPVATFTDYNPNLSAGNFEAYVDFGDGNGPVPATIAGPVNGGLYTISAHPLTPIQDIPYGTPFQPFSGMSVYLADDADGGFNSGPVAMRYNSYGGEPTGAGGPIFPTGPMVYVGDNNGVPHDLRLVENAATGNIEVYDHGLLVFTQPDLGTQGWYNYIYGDPGADNSLTIDFGGGPFTNEPIYFDGGFGPGVHTLTVVNGSFTDATYDNYSATNGDVYLDNQYVNYGDTAAFLVNAPTSNDTFYFWNSSDTATVADSGIGGETTVSSLFSVPVTFVNPDTSLTFDDTANAGTFNTIDINSFGSGFNASLDINFPNGTDTVNLNTSLALGSSIATGDLTITTGTINLNAASISTNNGGATGGTITFNGPVTLQNDLDVSTGAGAVAFNDTVNGAFNLAIHNSVGATTFTNTVGATGALASLEVDGLLTLGGTTIVADGAVAFHGDVTLTTSVQIEYTGTPGLLIDGSVLDLGSNQLTFFDLDIAGPDTAVISAQIVGGGNLSVNNVGSLALTNASNTFSGGTLLFGGTLQLNANGELGAGVTTIFNGALEATASFTTSAAIVLGSLGSMIEVDSGVTFEIDSQLTGIGALNATGAGTLVPTNTANSYNGGTVLANGTVQISADGQLSNGTVTIGAATLEATASFTTAQQFTVNNPASTIMVDSGQQFELTTGINGTSNLNLTGAGVLFLDGDNTYSGGTNATGAALFLNGGTIESTQTVNANSGGTVTGFGTIKGDVSVNSGGTLSGSGPGLTIAGSVVANAGGSVSPGTNPVTGEIFIGGNYTQDTGAFLNINIQGNTTPGTDYDTLSVAGTANLGGTLNVNVINGFTPTVADDYQFLSFGSSTGDFGTKNGFALGNALYLAEQINPGTADLIVHQAVLQYLVQPANPELSGQAFNVQVEVTDTLGGLLSFDNTDQITLTLNQNTFHGGATSITQTVSGGIASFTLTIDTTANGYQLTAGNNGFADVPSNVFSVDLAPSITSGNGTTFTVGQGGTFSVTTDGFPTPSLTETGPLPSGVTFVDNGDGTGTLAGTPAGNTGGIYTVSLTASNGIGSDATQTFNLTVDQQAAITSGNAATFTVGQAGSFTIDTTGFPAPALSDGGFSLPTGVSFHDNGNGTATLSGTPLGNVGGIYSFTVTAHNGVGTDATQTFSLTVNQTAAITSGPATTFTVGNGGTFTVTTAGFPAPSLSDGGFSLPSGVTFHDNGNGTATLSGTPAAATGGSYSFTLTAHNGIGSDATQTFTLVIDQAAAITSGNADTFTVTQPGTFTVTTTGFPAAAISKTGSLPAGVTFLDNGDGTATLSGTPTGNVGGVYNLTITAHNGVGSDATQTFTLTVDQSAAITSGPATTFTVGNNGTFSVTTVGFPTATLTESGSLPTGVSFTDNGNGTATLTGTPAASMGGVYSFTITAHNGIGADATQDFTLTVHQAAAITSASNTTFTIGQLGTFTVQSTGFPTAALTESGSLPTGVSFTDNGNGTATLTGTPGLGVEGNYLITLTAHNGVGTDATQSFTLEVGLTPDITSPSSISFTVGNSGNFTVTATGFPTPSLTESGSLPGGISFTDHANGTATLGGTPAAGTGGTYTLTLTAQNGIGSDATQTFTLTIDEAPAITSVKNTTFTVGQAGTFTVQTTGFPIPSINDGGFTLPSGVTFTDNGDGTATFAGTPQVTTGGNYFITLHALNGVGSGASQSFTLTIDEAPQITSAATTTFTVGTNGTFFVTTGHAFPAGVTLSEAGALPSGVSFIDNGDGTAKFTGTPAANSGGPYAIMITADNGLVPAGTQNFTLVVDEAPSIITPNTTTFTVGTLGGFTVFTIAYPAATLTESGNLPAGVTFTDNGDGTASLAGIPGPNTGGNYALSFTAHNGVGSNATQAFTLTVDQPAAITSGSATTFTVGQAGNFAITTTGFPKPTLTESGSLPGGVTFHDNGNGTGSLAGMPFASTGGTYSFTITAHNGVGADATQAFTLTIDQAPAITSPTGTTFTVDTSGTFTVNTTGFPTVSLTESGALPNGVTFTDNGNGTATLAGIPGSSAGGSYSLTITGHNGVGLDATQTFTLTVDQPPGITNPADATFTAGTNGGFTISTNGFPVPAITENGGLPGGVTFTDNGDGTGALAGIPGANTGGIYSFTLTADNGIGSAATQTFTLTVDEAPTITSANHVTFTVGTTGLPFTITSTGFPTASLSESASLPSGISFTPSINGTATLSGTPAIGTGGTYTFDITAQNGVGSNATQTFTLTIDEAPAITSADNVTFTAGSSATPFTVTTSGFPAATLTESGALPSGVSFTQGANGTATLSGTPAANTGGTYTLTITANNGVGLDATQTFTLTIDQAPAITSANNTTFAVGIIPSPFTVTTTGFPAPALTESGSLPGGVTFHDNGNGTATLDGTPAAATGGTYSLTITASNGIGSEATQTFTLTIDQAPAITSGNSTTFTAGSSATPFTVTTTGFPAPTLTENGALPSGVSFTPGANGTATLSGTPAANSGGTYTITITASNGVGTRASQTFTLTVDQQSAITNAPSSTFTVGTLGSFTITTTGFPNPALSTANTLPAGVSLVDNNNGTATLTGTPQAGTGGVATFTITAHNGIGADATQTFSLTVDEAPSVTSANQTTFTAGTHGSFTVTTGHEFPAATTLSENGSLPTGVAFTDNGDGTGTLTGTPAAGTGGTYTVSLVAHNGITPDATQSFTLTVAEAPSIVSVPSAAFIAGQAPNAGLNTFTVRTFGFSRPSLSVAGLLPTGVTFHDNGDGTATITGTPGLTTGVYPLVITAAANGVGPAATQSFGLVVNGPPVITSANNATFIAGQANTFALTSVPGVPAKAATFKAVGLPKGVTLKPGPNGTATLTGKPLAKTGGTYTVTLTATNGVYSYTQTFTLQVDQAPTFSGVKTATIGTGQVAGLPVIHTTGLPFASIQLTAGNLPNGLTFVDNGNGTATFTGSATEAGIFPLTISASNATGSTTEIYTLTVRQADITSGNSVTMTPGQTGSFSITTDVATTGVKNKITETGVLPGGIRFKDNGNGTATLSGKPSSNAGGTYPITLTVNSGGVIGTQHFTLTVTPNGQLPTFTGPASTTFTTGQSTPFPIGVTAGTGTVKFTKIGTLPAGVTLSPAGVLSGKPAAKAGGVYHFTIAATNAAGVSFETFTLTVNQPLAIIKTAKTGTFGIGQVSTILVQTTGFPVAQWSLSGNPTWVEIVDNGNGTATLVATPPPGTSAAAPYQFTITAHNTAGSSASLSFTAKVSESPIITSSGNLTVSLNQVITPFTVTTAALPTGIPVAKITATGLPSGLKIKDNGNGTATITGTPKKAGTYKVLVTAKNGVLPTALQILTIVVQ